MVMAHRRAMNMTIRLENRYGAMARNRGTWANQAIGEVRRSPDLAVRRFSPRARMKPRRAPTAK
jgi:hypothetical protein